MQVPWDAASDRRDQAQGPNGPGTGGRRVTVAQVWVKVSPEGEPHPKAARLIEEIRGLYPQCEVRLDREQGYFDRALLRVLCPRGPEAQEAARELQELIRSYRGGMEVNLLTGKVFTLRVPVDARGEVTDPRARGALEEIQRRYPKVELQRQEEGGVATIELYLRDLADARRFLTAYRTIRDIVRRHKTEPAAPGEREE